MSEKLELTAHQQVFMVFFAIFWGLIANVQPRWRAFHFPLMFRLTVVTRRILLAFFLLDVVPVLYFWETIWIIGYCPTGTIHDVAMYGVVPAFGIFGIYRIWIAIIELYPAFFYCANRNDIPEPYRHTEPTYRHDWDEQRAELPVPGVRESDLPVLDIARGAGWRNMFAGFLYLAIAYSIPLLWFVLWWSVLLVFVVICLLICIVSTPAWSDAVCNWAGAWFDFDRLGYIALQALTAMRTAAEETSQNCQVGDQTAGGGGAGI